MDEKEIKKEIVSVIQGFRGSDLSHQTLKLFKTLGYNTSEYEGDLGNKTYLELKSSYEEVFYAKRFDENKALVEDWNYVDILFQLAEDDISNQQSLFKKRIDNTIMESYLFFVIELQLSSYSRTQLANITREINKIFTMPVMVVFKHGKNISISVINRRLHKRASDKDVLEKVTLIKDIYINLPLRAHIEILFDLSFAELRRVHKVTNFVELHRAWSDILDTKELNKKFYKELSHWYFWAINEVHFPNASTEADKTGLFSDDEKVREHNAKNLIRLLTRILFVWFVKEKNLIPEELFDESYISKNLINEFQPKKDYTISQKTQGSKYYRAILQNLFFATLNQTAGKRGFHKEGTIDSVTNTMRYESYFKNPKEFINLVERVVPFMNGGLFECLDAPDPKLKGKKGGEIIIYEDGFLDTKDNPLCVPDYIFFGKSEHADLSVELGDKKQKNVEVKGLINILKSYKFTVTENTPIEEDIALDPELLGRVFENLLASYNPETKTTARKQTGSFYTPREIVDYMVNESLKAYLQQKLETEAGIKAEDAEPKLEQLLGYNEEPHQFNNKEVDVLINAIDSCKILDPACGSGAFPMGILHKLVHVLHKLDRNNEKWRGLQKQKAIKDTEEAFNIGNKNERDEKLKEISDIFEKNSDDYGRKLYLIESCIYGVDIQPIAIQISKLRFFISLIVEQKVNGDDKNKNFGILPLPNLETKFVAANTLIGIEKPDQMDIFDNKDIEALEDKLKAVRHRMFSAKTPATKRKLREEDQAIRDKMGELLIKYGLANETARQLAAWDPYNQNTSSPFFDPEWMFWIKDGFDVVIGNPPYLREKGNATFFYEVNNSEFGKKYHQGKMDFWFYFLHQAINITNIKGIIAFITPRYWINSVGASNLIKRIKKNLVFKVIIDIGKLDVFEEVAGQHMVSIYSRNNSLKDKTQVIIKKLMNEIKDIDKDKDTKNLKIYILYNCDLFTIDNQININQQYIKYNDCKLLGELYDVSQGVVEAVDRVSKKSLMNLINDNFIQGQGVFVLNENELNNLNCKKNELEIIKKYLEPTDIGKYSIRHSGNYLIYSDKQAITAIKKGEMNCIKNHLDLFKQFITSSNKPYGLHRPRNKKYFESPKIIFKSMFVDNEFMIDYSKYYVGMSFAVIINKTSEYKIEYLLALLNSKLALYWFYSNAKHRGAGVDVGVEKLRSFPVKIKKQIEYLLLILMVKYIIYNTDRIKKIYMENIIDAMVYELYFPEEIKAANAEVLKHLTNLPELQDDWSDDKKLAVIDKIYKELSDPKHPVSIAIERQKSVPEVRIIEGLDK